jgi:hypothetical protein
MYPFAFGFIDGEATDNWTWFMTQLHKAIGDLPILAISSDACKGLENAVKKVFPQAEHRECFRHLMNNFIKRSGGDVLSRMYPAARAYRESVFNYFYKSITYASPQVLVWMEAHHYKLWMRAFNLRLNVIISLITLLKCLTIGSRTEKTFLLLSLQTNSERWLWCRG